MKESKTYEINEVIFVKVNIEAKSKKQALEQYAIMKLDSHDYMQLIENAEKNITAETDQ